MIGIGVREPDRRTQTYDRQEARRKLRVVTQDTIRDWTQDRRTYRIYAAVVTGIKDTVRIGSDGAAVIV